ncbi:recombination protein NinG [Glaciimonas sp. PCH181]|uniref:recombination protein NinG n=1 Tax=Glaciimonas sp. PCH181 TaxID=2133943 RepID=UPI000D336C83|nr:recombination protein NinG [Glaciimonas sp. PCH181]PUA19603.1 ninG protein [Glaciimonas sp. PCH181]
MIRSTFKPKAISGVLRTAKPRSGGSTLVAKPKTRKCAICKTSFVKRTMAHVVCSPPCAVANNRLKAAKADRKITAARKLAIKPRAKWMAEAQAAFNAFIRQRDINQLCISSGRPLPSQAAGGGFDAGHYRSIGSAPHLRFDERNVHGQSKQDNRYLAGNAVDYRIGLIARIGIAAVEELEADNAFRKWSIDDLTAIKAKYKNKLKELVP